MKWKRLMILCGHYGSGKTNVAVNMAYKAREQFDRVAVADLDIVNPYFRTLDSREEFEKRDIRLICSEYANTNLDIPALPQEMYALTDDKSIHGILDIGGDDRGAYALGRLSPAILEENDYEMLCVMNCYRPLTRDPQAQVEIMREIETACGIPFTGLINNSNLGKDTTVEDILDSVSYAEAVSEMTGLPIVATTTTEELGKILQEKLDPVFTMKLQARPVE